jgi:hypothetical protein
MRTSIFDFARSKPSANFGISPVSGTLKLALAELAVAIGAGGVTGIVLFALRHEAVAAAVDVVPAHEAVVARDAGRGIRVAAPT